MGAQVVTRLFADDYSSTGQLAWSSGWRGAGGRYWRDDYLGQLRFDSLVVPTLVIPDSHLFDGPFFLGTGPASLCAQLGRPGRAEGNRKLPFEVRGRAGTLSESLAVLLRRPGRDTLNAFVFKSISDIAARSALAAELGRTPESDLDRELARTSDPAKAVAAVLRKCLVRVGRSLEAGELIDPLEEGWRTWLAESDLVRVEAWPTYENFEIAAALAVEPLAERDFATADGREALAQIRALVARGSEHRADVSELLAPRRAAAVAAGDGPTQADLELIDIWYSRGRYRALAARHGCACVQEDRPWLPALSAGQVLLRKVLGGADGRARRVPLPEYVLTRLGDLPDDDFSALVHDNRRQLDKWWSDGYVGYFEALGDALVARTPSPSRPGVGIAQYLPAAMGGAAGLGVGKLLGDAAVGGLVGTLTGVGAQAALARRPTETDRVRMRVLEAAVDRRCDDSQRVTRRAGAGGYV